MDKMPVKPIGFVRTELEEDELRKRRYNSDLVINPIYEDALEGIEGFSHLNIVFWMHHVSKEERSNLKVRPRGRRDMPLLGVFATRSPQRPNPIGLTLVELIERRGNIVTVKGLDAIDGTPILDLKPYDAWDRAEKIRVPSWRRRLERDGTHKQ